MEVNSSWHKSSYASFVFSQASENFPSVSTRINSQIHTTEQNEQMTNERARNTHALWT
jgi:hypothetical protein